MAALTLTLLDRDRFIARADADDLLAVAGEGGPNSSAGRSLNHAKIDAVLARANDVAGSYLLGRWPRLAEIGADRAPQALAGAVFDLAWYWLREREGGRGTVDEIVRKRFEDAHKYFDNLASGKAALHLDLDDDGAADDGYTGRDTVHADFDAPTMTAALEGWR